MAHHIRFRCGTPLLALFAMLATTTVGQAQSSAPRPGQVDAEGLPLPDGAIARIGSARFRHDGDGARTLAFSPDGRMIACESVRGVHVFDVADGRLLHLVRTPSYRTPVCFRFIDDGKQLAIGISGGYGSLEQYEVLTYDFAESKVVCRRFIRGDHQYFLDFTTDGKQALIRAEDRSVSLWDIETGRKKWSIELPNDARLTTADRQLLVIVRGNGTEVRDIVTGKVVMTLPTPDYKNDELSGFGGRQSLCVDHARNGTTAFCIAQSNKIIVRDRSGADSVYEIPPPGREDSLKIHFGPSYRLCFSADARYLVCCDDAPRDTNGTYIWDLSKPELRKPIASLPGADLATFSTDGKWLALDISGTITLWRTTDWKPLFEPINGAFKFRDVFFSPDGNTVFGRTEFGWSAWPAAGGPGRLLMAEKESYFSWHLSPNGLVAVGSLTTGGDLLIDHLATGRKVRVPTTECGRNPWTELSPDGRYLKVTVSDDRRTRLEQFIIYDTQTGRVRSRQRATADTYFIHSDIDPGGAGLIRSLTRDHSENVQVRDYATGEHWALPVAHGLSDAKFSHDGKRLVIETVSPEGEDLRSGREHSLEVWDVTLGRRIGSLGKATHFDQNFAISADGRTIVSGDYDGTVHVFEVASCEERMTFRHFRQIRSIDLDAHATRALASSDDAPAYVWDLIGNPGPWNSSRANEVWDELASADAKQAYRSITLLRVNPREATDFLKSRVKIATVPAHDTVVALIARLDAPGFRDREMAQRDLTNVAEVIRPVLSAAKKSASDEARRRIALVLDSAEAMSAERLRQVRACEVLEAIRTPEAVDLLRRWSNGPDGSRLTTEAKQSLARIER